MSLIRTTAVRAKLRSIAASKAAMCSGKKRTQIARIASTFKDEDQRQRYEAEYEELRTNYGYVFD